MDIKELQEELKKTRRELLTLYEVGNLMRSSLELDEVVYLVLSATTSHEGLGFNRAILFLLDDNGRNLEGKMGIGPRDPSTSSQVWQKIQDHQITLEDFLDVYRKEGPNIDRELNQIAQKCSIPLNDSKSPLVRSAREGILIHVEGPDHLKDFEEPILEALNVGEFVTLPLKGRKNTVGVLLIDNIATKKQIAKSELRNLTMFADHAGLAIENAKTYKAVVETARQDSLTRLWNHGYFQELLSQAITEAQKNSKQISVIFFDIDDFKLYNDAFGHQAGDKALQAIARISKSVLRKGDFLARYGGEEFAMILPDSSKKEALLLGERLRNVVEREGEHRWQSELLIKLTISAGISTFPEDANVREKLIYCADAALYEAKKAGKNKVNTYQSPAVTKP